MEKFNINRFTTHFLSEAKRPMLTLTAGVIAFILLLVLLYSLLTDNDNQESAAQLSLPEGKTSVQKSGQFNEAYSQAINTDNDQNLQHAQQDPNGVAIPFVLNETQQQREPTNQTVSTCGCTVNETQLLSLLQKYGLNLNTKPVVQQLGSSDLYINHARQIVDKNNQPHLFNEDKVIIDSNGLLTHEDSQPILLDDRPLYLSNQGQIIDENTQQVPLRGQLQSSTGIIILSDGRYAFRPKNMTRQGQTDIYITRSGQLATVDGRPIRHAGNVVFKNAEDELVNLNHAPIRHENKTVLQNRQGYLVDLQGDVFVTPGILFSYTGILIDNYGQLANPLINMQQIGQSDLFLDEQSRLLDRFTEQVTHFNQSVRVGVGSQLFLGNTLLNNHQGFPINIDENGRLSADVGQGGIRSGWLLNSEQVAFDRLGQLTSRPGKLTQKASSSVYLTSDGLLTDQNARPLRYSLKHLFLDFSDLLPNGAIGLQTHDSQPVFDLSANKLYLSEEGAFVTQNNEAAQLGTLVTSQDQVVMQSNGTWVGQQNATHPLLDSENRPIFFNGKQVKVDASGQLVDENNQPLFDPKTGSPLFLTSSGVVVDEDNNPVDSSLFTTKQDVASAGNIQTLKPMIDKQGAQLLFNGKPIYQQNGKLVYADGIEVKDEEGLALKLENGRIVNSAGEPHGALNAQLATTTLRPLTQGGEQVTVNGKPAFLDKDGRIVDSAGVPITDLQGKVLRLNQNNEIETLDKTTPEGLNIVSASGEVLDLTGFDTPSAPTDNQQIPDQLLVNGQPVTFQGEAVYSNGQGQLFDAKGRPILSENGEPVFLKNGKLTDRLGKLVKVPGLEVTQSPSSRRFRTSSNDSTSATGITHTTDGFLIDKHGRPISYKGQTVKLDSKGNLVKPNGQSLVTSAGEAIQLNEQGELVTQSGNLLTESLLKDGNGAFLYGAGDTAATRIKQLGDSDLYLTEDGFVTDQDGRPILYQGEAVKVDPQTGALITQSGRSLRDATGARVYLTEDGQLVNDKLEAVSKLDVATTDGIAIIQNGKKVTASETTKTLGNSGVLIAENGLIIDEQGRPLTVDNEFVYQDEQGRLVTSSLRPVRFNGQRLALNNEGQLTGTDGSLVSHDGQPLALSELTTPLTPSLNIDTKRAVVARAAPVVPVVQPQTNTTPSREQRNESNQAGSASPKLNVNSQNQTGKGWIPLSTASVEEKQRFSQRYNQLYTQMSAQVTAFSADSQPVSTSFSQVLVDPKEPIKTQNSPSDNEVSTDTQAMDPPALAKAGDSLYAVTTLNFNSDLNSQLEVRIVGLPTKHPLFNAVAYANVEVRYDNAVFQFTRVCPRTLPCRAIQGIGLNAQTASAEVASHVDTHFWYRVGGLFTASFIKGVGEGIQQTGERTESFTQPTSRVSTTGLDTSDVIITGLGEVGEAFIPTFSQRANRPATVYVPYGEELVIRLLNDLSP